ncbi:Laccase domain protein yfiH (plasmid) [Legionella adelaidensis]|uniref:Purine nucleoside phosphorylase n=1 Tax=Legionella adelaidensis TaxID=45056 RepID=A0A0W0R4G7_9GAMM|nr:peptidoglycan editing factor PgeF [Legionella adelaidensis]KTC65941.1 Laccase domain protein YfiH [Legionella adelaidensis]VEH85561.1 Laccase domain protein yfiH [Legionella adelaidensis]
MKIFPANWDAPSNIVAFTTTREEGFSELTYAKNNLALHVGDQAETVLQNRQLLMKQFSIPKEPIWLEQIHSNICILAEEESNRLADAAVTRSQNIPLVIMTADCLPIMLCSKKGNEIAAIHAGWKGLAQGVVENTLEKMRTSQEDLIAWIGPAICGQCYQIGSEVKEAFLQNYPFTQAAFQPQGDRFLGNLPLMAELILQKLGLKEVYQSKACTFESDNTFYSYRREPKTGRIATLIWFQ